MSHKAEQFVKHHFDFIRSYFVLYLFDIDTSERKKNNFFR